MLFRSFESNKWEAIRDQMEIASQSFVTTIVFIFCDPSQNLQGRQMHKRLQDTYPRANVCLISGGNTSSNGNKNSNDTVVVTILAGSFSCRITPIGQEMIDVSPEGLSGIFLFGFGNTNPERDLRMCEGISSKTPVHGGAFFQPEAFGIFQTFEVVDQSIAVFFYGDIIFQSKVQSDVFPLGNSFKVGASSGTMTLELNGMPALEYVNSVLGESYIHKVLKKDTIEFPLTVIRNGIPAPRSIVKVDFHTQSITWSGSVIEGEDAHLSMLSSDQVLSGIWYCISFLWNTKHEGGFLFTDNSRYALLGESLEWNLKPDIENGIIGIFWNVAFTPFHGTNESLSQTLSLVIISDSGTTRIPDYVVRDLQEQQRNNPILNSFNFLRWILQNQLVRNTSETNVLKEAMKDEKQRIDHLQSSQHEALKQIIDNAPVAIWMGDKEEQTVYANSRFEELVGYTLDEMMGRKSFEFWAKDSIATVQNNNEVREHGEKSTYEGDLLSKSNEIIPVRLTGIPIPTGTVGMMLDLRELRKEALERAQLQRLSDSKDSFLNIASHELRTPITSILWYISMLIDGDYGVLPEPAVKALCIIQSSWNRLFNIINHMLQLAKLESGHMILQQEAVSLREICQSIMNEVHAISLDRNIQMEFSEATLSEPPIIIGDMDQTRKAILNLVGNSLKFTPSGGKVSLDIHKQWNELVLSVTDTGVGIAEKDFQKVFEKFGQSENPLSRTYEGTWLGLAFVKEVIIRMDGRIELQSEVGKWSCFSVFFTKLPPSLVL